MIKRERIVYDKYEALGYDIIKDGIPDLVLLKNGVISFIEVKSESSKLTESQERALKLLEKHGFSVKIERINMKPPISKKDMEFNSFMKSMTRRERTEYFNLPSLERKNVLNNWLSAGEI